MSTLLHPPTNTSRLYGDEQSFRCADTSLRAPEENCTPLPYPCLPGIPLSPASHLLKWTWCLLDYHSYGLTAHYYTCTVASFWLHAIQYKHNVGCFMRLIGAWMCYSTTAGVFFHSLSCCVVCVTDHLVFSVCLILPPSGQWILE